MKREELIKYCRYYKGEKENPYDGKNQDAAMFWEYESIWVDRLFSDTKFLKMMQDELIEVAANLEDKDPQIIDNSRPFSLVALLFNRWCKWCNDCHMSYKGVVGDFERWYKKYYLCE